MKKLVWLVLMLFVLSACAGETGTTTSSIPSLASAAKQVAARSPAMQVAAVAPTQEQQTQILQLIQAMFNGSPGADFLSQFAGLLAGGMSITTLADMLAATDLFHLPEFYPTTLTNQQFAEKFVNSLVGNTVSDANKNWAVGWITDQLNSGIGRGAAIWTAVSALASIPSSNPDWGTAATQLNNKISVSYYYSVTKAVAATDLVTLQAVTAPVTSNAATVTAATAAIDTNNPANPPSSKFLVATSGVSQDAAASDTNILFGIESHNTTKIIGAQLADFNGNLVGSFISTGRTGIASSVAFDGTNYLLIWEDDNNGTYTGTTGWQIYGQLISKAGQKVGAPFAISSEGVWFDGMKAVTYASGRYLVTYTKLIDPALGDDSHNRYIAGQLLATNGSKVGAEFRISDGNGQQSSVGTDGTNFIVAWVEDVNDTEIRARTISYSGSLGAEFSVNASSYRSDNPIAIAFDGTTYFIVWSEEVSADRWQVYGQKVAASGALIGGAIGIATNSSANQLINTVACGGGRCLVTWIDATNPNDWNLYGQYLTLEGALSGSRFAVSTDVTNQTGGVSYVNGRYFFLINSGVVMGENGTITAGNVYGAFME